MNSIEELENLCEGVFNRIGAKTNAMWQQSKALVGANKGDVPSSDEAGADDLPGSKSRENQSRLSRVHEVGVNATSMSLIKSCKNKIHEAQKKIAKLMEEGKAKKQLSDKAIEIYNKKIAQIEQIVKVVDSIAS